MKADIGDFETSRGYPLDLSAAATEIPGYEGCSAALQAAYNALPLGAQFVIRTGIATIPAGAVFRKVSRVTYGSGGRIARVINPSVDTITAGSAVDSFIASLAATTVKANEVTITGTALNGNGAARKGALIEFIIGADAGSTVGGFSASSGTALGYTAGGAGGGGSAWMTSDAGTGAFSGTFALDDSGSASIVVRYLGLTCLLTGTWT